MEELRMKNDGTWDWYHDDEQFEEHYEFDIQTVGEDYTCDMVHPKHVAKEDHALMYKLYGDYPCYTLTHSIAGIRVMGLNLAKIRFGLKYSYSTRMDHVHGWDDENGMFQMDQYPIRISINNHDTMEEEHEIELELKHILYQVRVPWWKQEYVAHKEGLQKQRDLMKWLMIDIVYLPNRGTEFFRLARELQRMNESIA